MAKGRGPDSAESREIEPHQPSALALDYAPAPPHLSEEERGIWTEVIRTKPVEWFAADSLPLLEAYCTVIVARRRLAETIRNTSFLTDAKALIRLIQVHDQQTRLCTHLATKMRLTQQARYFTQTAGRIHRDVPASSLTGNDPWEESDE